MRTDASLWQATLNAQEQNRAVTRYFTQSELKQLFQLAHPHRSETCEQVLIPSSLSISPLVSFRSLFRDECQQMGVDGYLYRSKETAFLLFVFC
jgi:hypothetical protein